MIARAVERLDGPNAPPAFAGHSLGAQFGKLYEPIRRLAGERARIVHSAWIVHEKRPKALYRFEVPAKFHDKGFEE